MRVLIGLMAIILFAAAASAEPTGKALDQTPSATMKQTGQPSADDDKEARRQKKQQEITDAVTDKIKHPDSQKQDSKQMGSEKLGR